MQHRQLGDDEADGAKDRDGWVVAPAAGGLVKEVKEKTVKTREEKEERLETEDVQHLGDISDDVSRRRDLCLYLKMSDTKSNKSVEHRIDFSSTVLWSS